MVVVETCPGVHPATYLEECIGLYLKNLPLAAVTAIRTRTSTLGRFRFGSIFTGSNIASVVMFKVGVITLYTVVCPLGPAPRVDSWTLSDPS
jgi:hypothetical protein